MCIRVHPWPIISLASHSGQAHPIHLARFRASSIGLWDVLLQLVLGKARTLGNRNRPGRAQNKFARRSDCAALQDPGTVQQEFYGLLMAHYAIRGLMHEAALKAVEDPGRLSFLRSVWVVQRRLATHVTIPPSAEEGLA